MKMPKFRLPRLSLSKIRLPKIKFSRQNVLYALLIIAVLIASGIIGYMLRSKHAKQATNEAPLTYSTDKPDEKKPDKGYDWKGGPNDPKKINLPTINKDGFIQKVGVDQKKAMAVPGNIHVAGWFVEMARPGDQGLSIIDGHVDGYTDRGIFYDLKNLKKDDQFSIEFGDGHTTNFKVKDIQSVPNAQAEAVLYSQDPKIKSQLNLITCGGVFNKSTREYENRIIVITEATQ